MVRATIALTVSIIILAAGTSRAQKWSEWENDHAVAKHGLWLVIDAGADSTCYMKQSYDDGSDHMDLIVTRQGAIHVVTPFYRGITSEINYWVDDGARRKVPFRTGLALGFELDPAIMPEMKAGNLLYMTVRPRGQARQRQIFILSGFTAAARKLAAPPCR